MTDPRPSGLNALDCPNCGAYVEDRHNCPALDYMIVDCNGFVCNPSTIPLTITEAERLVVSYDEAEPTMAPHGIVQLVPVPRSVPDAEVVG